jgi:hypothetical protein
LNPFSLEASLLHIGWKNYLGVRYGVWVFGRVWGDLRIKERLSGGEMWRFENLFGGLFSQDV